MTRRKHLKRRIRDRKRKTGESYTTAKKHILARRTADVPPLPQAQEAQPPQPQEAQLPQPQEALPSASISNNGAAALTSAQAIEPATRELTTPPFPLQDWIKRHRLDEEALQRLEKEAIRAVDGGRHINTDKLAACAKAVLISELIDGAPRRDRYPELPCDALHVTDEYSELEIFPSDHTPVSEDLIRNALEVAAAFSDGEDWEILSYWSSGHISGATPRARKAAVRFLRLMGAKVNVSVYKDLPEPPSALTPSALPRSVD